MDIGFTEEQEMLRETARKFLDDECTTQFVRRLMATEEAITAEFWQLRGRPELHTRDEMERLGYPRPRGEAYYCLPLRAVDMGQWAEQLAAANVASDLHSLPH